ncbi:nitrogenase-stabilizing/protective protein NifW [Pararhodospirillum photometricum]|uniref:Nitrogenase-stabilizing/protective protein NifW n=1 Tax=Pararhodospirillum photometricum DSM 122 TaxID=1150469 RepID=H6SS68_PARPM|nr:nitrogenase-stabilizing/protective protein NifW [Pararhodospirillum photometricum]CCG07747.1 NifW [Pararhodospirillum photometricum DSM 122]
MSDFLTRLRTLPSAEEFFRFLDVAFDPHVLAVNRLHILNRYRLLLRSADLGDGSEAALRAAHRACLEQAHADFLTGDPNKLKVFRVFEQARGRGRGFVGLESIAPLDASA